MCESLEMRTGVCFSVSSSDRQRLEAIVADGNRPQKHVWRARIILLSNAGLGTPLSQDSCRLVVSAKLNPVRRAEERTICGILDRAESIRDCEDASTP